ncbi:MAG TPA: ion channel [Xenococcaceae cyanobacterium]
MFYLLINTLFALAYLTTKDGIANAKPGSFSDAFFFSVQSLSTIGYGAMYPQTIYAQILVTFEVLVGLLLVAMMTGLIFARFAQPKARVLFSKVAVVCPFNDIPTLMFRVANQRDNRLIEARIKMSLLINEVSSEGIQLRRFYNLPLLRSESPSFRLSWLVMHPIDEFSPLYEKNALALAECDAQILVILTGLDETFSLTIHARYIYRVKDILWSRRFVDILRKSDHTVARSDRTEDTEEYTIDYQHFHDVIPLDKS